MFGDEKGNKFVQKTWPSFLLDLGGILDIREDVSTAVLPFPPFRRRRHSPPPPPPPPVSEPTTGKRKRSGIEPFREGENSPKPLTYLKDLSAIQKLKFLTFLPCSFRYK